MTLVDTNVLLDVLQGDVVWADWSRAALNLAAAQDTLFINPLVYAELSLAFVRIEELEAVVHEAGLEYRELPKEALFLGAKAFQAYRRGQSSRTPRPAAFFYWRACCGAWCCVVDARPPHLPHLVSYSPPHRPRDGLTPPLRPRIIARCPPRFTPPRSL